MNDFYVIYDIEGRGFLLSEHDIYVDINTATRYYDLKKALSRINFSRVYSDEIYNHGILSDKARMLLKRWVSLREIKEQRDIHVEDINFNGVDLFKKYRIVRIRTDLIGNILLRESCENDIVDLMMETIDYNRGKIRDFDKWIFE